MTRDEWWSEDCPKRGPALSHIPNDPGNGRCLFCDLPVGARLLMTGEEVDARLVALGLTEPIVEVQQIPHDDDTIVEPRYVTGEGPQGFRYGLGRGDASGRFLRRVEAFVGWRAWLAARGLSDDDE